MESAENSDVKNSGDKPALLMIRAWNLPHLVHGFLTRQGGVSRGSYAAFNLGEGVGDDPEAVSANWERWHAAFPNLRVARLQQVHGKMVHVVDTEHAVERRIGDGMVTDAPGVALAIFTADCVPVLLTDPEAGIIGALHAGWRGTLAGIASEGMNVMAALGAQRDRVRVALGPSIGSCCFEVDAELGEHFVSQVPGAAACCRPGRPGKNHLDLRGIIRQQLLDAGVVDDSIVDAGPCTRCDSDRFFSRRAARGAATGVQMSFIGMSLKG
jgi:YfiH family protein